MAQSTRRVGNKLAARLSLSLLLLLAKCSLSEVEQCDYDASKWSAAGEPAQCHFTIVANGTLPPRAFRRYVSAAYSRLCDRAANANDTLQLVQFADTQVVTSVSRRSAFGKATHGRLLNAAPAAAGERPANGSVAGLCAALGPVGRLVASQLGRPCSPPHHMHVVVATGVRHDAACHSASAQLVLNMLGHGPTAGETTTATHLQHVDRVRRAVMKGTTGTPQSTPDDSHTEYESTFKHGHLDKQMLIILTSAAGAVAGALFLLITGVLFVRKLQLNHRGGVAAEQKQSAAGAAPAANAAGGNVAFVAGGTGNKAGGDKKTA